MSVTPSSVPVIAHQISTIAVDSGLNLNISEGIFLLIAYILATCELDEAASPLEIEAWQKAALFTFSEYGFNSKVIDAVITMAKHISCCSKEELSLQSLNYCQYQ